MKNSIKYNKLMRRLWYYEEILCIFLMFLFINKETLRTNNSLDHSSSDDIQITFDIRHTAPQHRTHLEYGGYGLDYMWICSMI